MNDANFWFENNEKYLAIALEWLRLRLQKMAGEEVADTDIEQAYAAMAEVAAVEPYPTLISLSRRFGLSAFEQKVLLLCAGMELDTGIAGLCAKAQKNSQSPYPTFALALSLFNEAAWDVVSPERPLRYWQLIEINRVGSQPLITSALKADERIVNYLKGLNYLDDRLASLVMPVETNVGILPPSQKTIVDKIIYRLKQANSATHLPIIELLGSDSSSKELIASHTAAAFGLQLYRLPSGLLPTPAAELETFLRLWQRESILMPVAIYLDAKEQENSTAKTSASPLKRFLSRYHNLLFLDTYESPQLSRASVSFDITKPTAPEQQAAWTNILDNSVNPESPSLLASQFNLNLSTIEKNASIVFNQNITDKNELYTRLWNACLVSTRPQLDNLAQRIDTKATWNDIVLPSEETNLLHQIADQVKQRRQVYENWGFQRRMNRGMGISALFAGESGTGKTMAAEVVANSLQLNLYRIDLSAVVSKYIGETEKNLRKLFDAAEDGGAILFFDEADALFGKRSEVKDSHDRYANIEINYLLQRIESYRGLAILATNMKSSLDTAFLRRLRFIINFPFPGKLERKRMWQKVFPEETPIESLDFERLARLNLTGGSIHNIAINAAFLAAREGTAVTMQFVLAAARTEFRKLERPINEADFA
ncbi:AAA+ family ATPase [Rivularia sp. PCC 7116]|uniref:ATP-binding protein n=1 Tax=Rivularia sp. PCC 7116 TaxID=373994 RepID=UPI00029EE2FC|nr:ATP-binding protein [Rivularia sp. PCC 7116]AFY57573.1 AAA+ family ATPase [Rivularia sp. PCC 7116]